MVRSSDSGLPDTSGGNDFDMNHDYVKGRLIAHAGGAMGPARYTNSWEAFENSCRHVSLVEFDICRAANGLIVAHDGLRKTMASRGSFQIIPLRHSVERSTIRNFIR